MALESHISASEDVLLDGLSFKTPGTGSYITEKKYATWACQSGNRFAPNSQSLMTFKLTDPNWLSGFDAKLMFTLHNNSSSNPLTPVVSPMCVFTRMRTIVSGQVCEDVSQLERCITMMETLQPEARRFNNQISGWGGASANHDNQDGYDAIPASGSRTVVVTIPSALLNQPKWLPLGLMGGLTIELELGSADQAFSGTGNDWFIDEPRVLGSVYCLDSSVQNSFASHMLSSKPLSIPYSPLFSAIHLVASKDFDINVARGFTRLDTIYCTLYKASTGKFANTFYHAAGATNPLAKASDIVQFQTQLGAKKMPEREIRSLAEFFLRLQQSQNVALGTESMAITTREYHSDKFITAIDCERSSGGPQGPAAYTGLSSRDGALLQLSWKNTGGAAGDAPPEQAHVVLQYSAVLQLQDGTATIYE